MFHRAHIFSSAIRYLWQFTMKIFQTAENKTIKRFKDKMKPKPLVDYLCSCRLHVYLCTQILTPANAFYYRYLQELIFENNFSGTRTLQRAFIVSPHRKKDSMERVRYGLKECSQVGIDRDTSCHIKLEKSSIINQAQFDMETINAIHIELISILISR